MSKGTILFIDDDSFLRKVYFAELSEKGFTVELAVDGEDGINKVYSVNPDLIILDLIMPKKSGFEVLTDLKRQEKTRNIPVVVLSNLAHSDDQKRALDLGASDYLVKDNTTLDIIAQKIEQHLQGSKRQKSDLGTRPSKISISEKNDDQKSTPPAPRHVVAQADTGPSRGHNFCYNCGYKIKKGEKFCPDCGAKQVES